MKKLITSALALACVFALSTGAVAEEKKTKKSKKAKTEASAKGDKAAKKKTERTIKGELVCAHCALGKGESCANAIKVTNKKTGKEMVYFLGGDAANKLGKGKGQKVVAKGKIERKGKGKEATITLLASSLAEQ
jgi:hypothetical protein